MPSKNDWNEYKKLILDFKDTTQNKLDSHDEKLDRLLEVAAGLKIKVAIGASVISLIITSLAMYIGG